MSTPLLQSLLLIAAYLAPPFVITFVLGWITKAMTGHPIDVIWKRLIFASLIAIWFAVTLFIGAQDDPYRN